MESIVIVLLQADTVSYSGDDIKSVASHFHEIDLQDNLIYEWNEVTKII